ncbi:hypothetical protein RSSM_03432 [Rhodopirellula sallentina SM41]|uniref:TraD/TraG TraM recognition site domain-containing protein n=1 Tax=Rhodopirellula sallentina SM41 TaxID=1263870 RepID=M5UGH0_9BACT|nr:hypothetical protein RSSM_03432 [Rhodopirellula sallentina SM41]
MFVIDPMGGLAEALLNYLAHPYLCTDEVRKRLVYLEPADTDWVMPFSSLDHRDADELYYALGRHCDCMLRTGRDHDLTTQLRLRRWLYTCFLSTAMMRYPPAAAQFLLRPGTEQHEVMLSQLPDVLQLEWAEIINAGSRERITMLDSTRNRLAPFFSCPALSRMLSRTQNYFDVARFFREKRIVIINLDTKGKLDRNVAHAIGGLLANQIIEGARNLSPMLVGPSILVMDEFQHFVDDTMYENLPLLRQRGMGVVLSHQSFDQLIKGEVDMSSIVWQARSRVVLPNDGADADLIAQELASLNYDPKAVKDEIVSFRQKKVGQQLVKLHGGNSVSTTSSATDETRSLGGNTGTARPLHGGALEGSKSHGESWNRGQSEKKATSVGETESWSETLVDILEDFYEVSGRTFYTFEDQMRCMARDIRQLRTGQGFLKLKDDPRLRRVDFDRLAMAATNEIIERRAELLERNYRDASLFLPKAVVEQDWERFVSGLAGGTVIPPHLTRGIEDTRENEADDIFLR